MTGKTRICVMDLRGGPAREYEAIPQRMKAMPHHMVVMQHDEDSLTDDAPKTMCIEQANQGSNFLFNTRGRTRDQDSNWETSLSFWANLPGLIQGEEIHLHYESARHSLPDTVCPSSIPTKGIGTTMERNFLHGLANAVERITDEIRPQESRANQSRVTGSVVPDIPIRGSHPLCV